jgi:hypothetical protein
MAFNLLLVALVFFPFKLIGGVSVFYLILMYFIFFGIKSILTSRYLLKNEIIWILLILLVIFRVFWSMLDIGWESALAMLFLKGFITFFGIYGVSAYIIKSKWSEDDSIFTITTLFVILSSMLVYLLLFVLSDVAFNYDSLTRQIGQLVHFSFSTDDVDFESRLVMRNSLGEIFALILIIVSLSKSKYKKFISSMVFVFVIISFSRKALLVALPPFFLALYSTTITNKSKKLIYWLLFTALLISALLFAIGFNIEARQLNFADEARLLMNAHVLSQDFYELLVGNGKDAIYSGKNIHSAPLNELYKFGIIGFLILSLIYISLLREAAFSIANKHLYGFYLLVPIVSLLVSSIFEFIMTPASLLAIGIYYGKKYQKKV